MLLDCWLHSSPMPVQCTAVQRRPWPDAGTLQVPLVYCNARTTACSPQSHRNRGTQLYLQHGTRANQAGQAAEVVVVVVAARWTGIFKTALGPAARGSPSPFPLLLLSSSQDVRFDLLSSAKRLFVVCLCNLPRLRKADRFLHPPSRIPLCFHLSTSPLMPFVGAV